MADATPLPPRRSCDNCGKVAQPGKKDMKLCGRCKKARYCSKYCQWRHWKDGHRLSCKPFGPDDPPWVQEPSVPDRIGVQLEQWEEDVIEADNHGRPVKIGAYEKYLKGVVSGYVDGGSKRAVQDARVYLHAISKAEDTGLAALLGAQMKKKASMWRFEIPELEHLEGLCVRESKICGAELGLFTKQAIPQNKDVTAYGVQAVRLLSRYPGKDCYNYATKSSNETSAILAHQANKSRWIATTMYKPDIDDRLDDNSTEIVADCGICAISARYPKPTNMDHCMLASMANDAAGSAVLAKHYTAADIDSMTDEQLAAANTAYMLDSLENNNCRLVYHSGVTRAVTLQSVRPIEKGEELTCPYGLQYWLEKSGAKRNTGYRLMQILVRDSGDPAHAEEYKREFWRATIEFERVFAPHYKHVVNGVDQAELSDLCCADPDDIVRVCVCEYCA